MDLSVGSIFTSPVKEEPFKGSLALSWELPESRPGGALGPEDAAGLDHGDAARLTLPGSLVYRFSTASARTSSRGTKLPKTCKSEPR